MIIDISNCTGDPETCPAPRQALSEDVFREAVSDLDPEAIECRRMLGGFLQICVEGKCPGRMPELYTDTMREILARRASN